MVLVETMLTPKYLLLALTAVFAVASIYSRLQVENMKKAIDSYQRASGATAELRDRLSETLSSAKADREKLQAQLSTVNGDLMAAQTTSREKEQQITGLLREKETSEKQAKDLLAELKRYRDNGSADMKELQARLDAAQTKATELSVKNGKLEEQLTASANDKKNLDETSQARAKRINEQQQEIETLRQTAAQYYDTNNSLQRDRTLLSFARTFIQDVRQEARRSFGDMDKQRVRQWLQQFDDAEKNIVKNSN